MALFLLLAASVLFSLRALTSWRSGIALMIVLAAIQDPLRKLVPGTPGWLTLATAPVFIAAVFASRLRTKNWWKEFRLCYPNIAQSIQLLALLSLPAAVVSASYGAGSWLLTIFGAFSYSLIFFAIIAGFHFPRSIRELRKILVIYCLVHGVVLAGAMMQWSGEFKDWSILGSQALGYTWVRWGWGYTVDMIAGFYRSSDVMGWHASAVCMLSLLLARTGKGSSRTAWVALSFFAMVALILCGRRKMVYMLPVFFIALAWIYWQAGRAAQVMALIGLAAIPALSVFIVGDLIGERSANLRYYSGEGLSESAWETIGGSGFRAVYYTYLDSGFFGYGLGTASPGSQHLQVERPHVWQESGTSRIMVELGVPGSIGFLLVMISIVYSIWNVTITQARQRTPQSPYAAGLLAFFVANVGSLTVSGQVLADPFIGAFLGFLVGLSLSVVRLRPEDAFARKRKPQCEFVDAEPKRDVGLLS